MKRILVKFYKRGDARFLSHRETMRALERALRRSGAALLFTEGYNPRPRMSFSPALPLGVAAEAEYLEVSVVEETDLQAMRENMHRSLPSGLGIVSLQVLPPSMPRLSRWTRYGLYRVEAGDRRYHLALRLSGEGEGRLKEALERLGEYLKADLQGGEVTRVGIYASRDEVAEEVTGAIYLYRGKEGELEVMQGGHKG